MGDQHIDGPLHIKYWGIRTPAIPAALTAVLNGHPQRSESLTLRSEWRRASQTPKAGRCTFLGGQRTRHVFYLLRLQLHRQQTEMTGKRVLTTVTSQVSGLPACQGMRVSPSGRLPSVLVRPLGSLLTGIPAAVKERAIASLTAWCLAVLLGAFLHTKP